jgi:hypothetical protein
MPKASAIANKVAEKFSETRAAAFAGGRVAAKLSPVGVGLTVAEKILAAKEVGAADEKDIKAWEERKRKEKEDADKEEEAAMESAYDDRRKSRME